MRSIIMANGVFTLPVKIKKNDFIIAANGGIANCLELGLIPNLAIGDFDSTQEEILEKLENLGTEILKFPVRKDETDLELAVNYAVKAGYEEIVLFAALGKRWDQTIANFLLPVRYPNNKIKILDEQQEIHYIHEGKSLHIQGQPGDTLSLIPLSNLVTGITTTGLEYPLLNGVLHLGKTRGVSNRMTGKTVIVKITGGILLCAVTHRKSLEN